MVTATIVKLTSLVATLSLAFGPASVAMSAEETWTAWVRAGGAGKQPFFVDHGSSASKAKREAERKCKQESGHSCSLVKAAPQKCAPLHLRSGKTIKPRGC